MTTKGFTFVEGKDTSKLCVFFGGIKMNSKPIPPFEFMETIFNNAHPRLLIRDLDGLWYHNGILEHPSIGKLAAFLKKASSKYQEITMAGASSGGFAAILFGHRVGANLVVALGPQTTARRKDRVELHDKRWPVAMKKINEDFTPIDLTKVLKKHNGTTKYNIYYCQNCDIDVKHAKRLDKVRGVSLHPLPCATHGVGGWLKSQGLLSKILDPEINIGF